MKRQLSPRHSPLAFLLRLLLCVSLSLGHENQSPPCALSMYWVPHICVWARVSVRATHIHTNPPYYRGLCCGGVKSLSSCLSCVFGRHFGIPLFIYYKLLCIFVPFHLLPLRSFPLLFCLVLLNFNLLFSVIAFNGLLAICCTLNPLLQQ